MNLAEHQNLVGWEEKPGGVTLLRPNQSSVDLFIDLIGVLFRTSFQAFVNYPNTRQHTPGLVFALSGKRKKKTNSHFHLVIKIDSDRARSNQNKQVRLPYQEEWM